MFRRRTGSTPFPYTTLFRSVPGVQVGHLRLGDRLQLVAPQTARSEEHTSELQSRPHLVCRLLLEKKNRPLYLQPIRNPADSPELAALLLDGTPVPVSYRYPV